MALTTLKEMAGTRRAKFGTLVIELASPGIGYILKAGGAQFVFLDMEHSGFGFDTVKQLLRYMEAASLPAIVRVPSRHYHHIARALDMGAEGIMTPMVGTAEEAQRIVAHAKYPPLGHRGVALGVAHDRYAPGAPVTKMRAANKRVAVFLLVETREGIENVDEIAAVEGIDGHLDRAFRPQHVARHPRPIRPPRSHRGGGPCRARLRQAQEVLRLPRHEC